MFTWFKRKLRIGVSVIDFNTVPWQDPIAEEKEYYVFRDKYPVTIGHQLYVPKYNDSKGVRAAFEGALREGRLRKLYGNADGFNIGINVGVAAGQTVMWPHVHLIPRHEGDTANPTGGVRNVIPGKGDYKSPAYNMPIC